MSAKFPRGGGANPFSAIRLCGSAVSTKSLRVFGMSAIFFLIKTITRAGDFLCMSTGTYSALDYRGCIFILPGIDSGGRK